MSVTKRTVTGAGGEPALPQPPTPGNMSTEERKQVADVFQSLDKNRDGVLDKMELILGLAQMNYQYPTLEAVESILEAAGLGTSTNSITLQQFEVVWATKAANGWSFAGEVNKISELPAAPSPRAGSGGGAKGTSEGWMESSGEKPPRVTPITDRRFRDVYALGKQLGSGAYSTVYLACLRSEGPNLASLRSEGPNLGEQFAIKVVQKQTVSEKDDVEALFEEVGILMQIHHPHIMRLFEFYEDESEFALVSELVSGGELFDRVVELQSYSEKEARDLVAIFLQALDFLHGHGIVHRDLKPENLLLKSHDDDTDIKLADFGFAKNFRRDRLDTVCGTPDYIAPEVCALLDLKKVPAHLRPCYDEKCDIWSAGVIAYILLGGYPPFYHDNRQELFKLIRKGAFEFHPEFWGEVSPEAKELISKMLTVDPSERPSAASLLAHPWLQSSAEALALKSRNAAKAEIKKWNARRKLKAAASSIIAVKRMNTLLQGLTKASEAGT